MTEKAAKTLSAAEIQAIFDRSPFHRLAWPQSDLGQPRATGNHGQHGDAA
jgi:hypothetical protein